VSIKKATKPAADPANGPRAISSAGGLNGREAILPTPEAQAIRADLTGSDTCTALTTHVTRNSAENLLEALKFAAETERPLNTSIDINWAMFAGDADDRRRLSKVQERLSKWFRRRGHELVWVWVREVGANGARHVHILVHVPPLLVDKLTTALERLFEPEGGMLCDRAIEIKDAYWPTGKLRYMLKGLSPADGSRLSIRCKPQGKLVGKRSGTTENIGAAARRRWQAANAVSR
jgi:hypothetical protein